MDLSWLINIQRFTDKWDFFFFTLTNILRKYDYADRRTFYSIDNWHTLVMILIKSIK